MRVPLTFGLIGHRDIPVECEETLRSRAHEVFATFRRTYAQTPFVVISSLASGADQILTEVALDCEGTSLVLALPAPESVFTNTLSDANCVQRFTVLKDKAVKTLVLPFETSSNRTQIAPSDYRTCSYFIAMNSQVMIAAWDETSRARLGGTTDTIEYKLQPRYRGTEDLAGSFEAEEEPGLVIHIPVYRGESTPRAPLGPTRIATQSTQFRPWAQSDALVASIGVEIEKLNRELSKSSGSASPDSPAKATATLRLASDQQAAGLRRSFRLAAAAIIAFSCMAVGLIDLGGVLVVPEITVIGICLVLITAVATFMLSRKRVQMRYQQSRALAEGARIQELWLDIGIWQPVSNYFLVNHDSSTAWIRRALRSCWVMDINPIRESTEKITSDLHHWLIGQINYFTGDRSRRGAIGKARREALSLTLIAAICLVTSFVALIAGVTLDLSDADDWQGFLVTTSIVWSFGLPTALGVAAYSELMGLRQSARRYALSLARFENANEMVVSQTTRDSEPRRVQNLGFAVGQQALQEVSDWLLTLKSKKIKAVQ